MQPARLGNPGPVFRALENEVGGFEAPAARHRGPETARGLGDRRANTPAGPARGGATAPRSFWRLPQCASTCDGCQCGRCADEPLHSPEAGIIRHLQEGLVPQGLSGSEQLADVVATEDDGEGAGFLRQWNHKVHGRAAQRGPIEKPQPMHDGIAGAVGETPFLMEPER